MENYLIEATEENYIKFPSVSLNYQSGLCEISGESFMTNSTEFYFPILQWLNKYTSDTEKKITFIFRLKYFNTSSSKSLFEIFEILNSFSEKGGKLYVEWYYDSQDKDLEDDIIDLALSSSVEITLVEN